jgi:ribosome recycling factor
MEDDILLIIEEAKEMMDKAISHLEQELQKITTGKANPAMLSSVVVDYYGANTPLSQIANISTPDPKTLSIQPWEKAMLDPCATAITNANLGLNPMNNGEMLIISIPILTEDRRTDLVKVAKHEGEEAKIGVRNARHQAIDQIKKLQKDGLSEDEARDLEAEVQELTNLNSKNIDRHIEEKDKDIMTV